MEGRILFDLPFFLKKQHRYHVCRYDIDYSK